MKLLYAKNTITNPIHRRIEQKQLKWIFNLPCIGPEVHIRKFMIDFGRFVAFESILVSRFRIKITLWVYSTITQFVLVLIKAI